MVIDLLTSLDFLAPGKPWPPPTETERLERYAQNRLLFEGKHEQVYKDWIRLLREDQQATLEMVPGGETRQHQGDTGPRFGLDV